MAIKIKGYGGNAPQTNVNFGSDFGPDEVMSYVSQFQNMKNSNQQEARAERAAVLQEAQAKFAMDNQQKTKNVTEAYDAWAGKGLDYSGILTGDDSKLSAAFGTNLPSFESRWDGFSKSANANGVSSPNKGAFYDQLNAENQRYMGAVLTRFNGIADNFLDAGHDADKVYEHMRDNYSADTVLRNAQMAGLDTKNVRYVTPGQDQGFIKSLFFSPKIEGGEEFNAPIKTTIGTGIAAYGKYFDWNQMKDLKGKELANAIKEAALRTKSNPVMEANDFKKMFNMTKTEFGDGTSDKAKKIINKIAREKSTLGKSSKYFKDVATDTFGKVADKSGKFATTNKWGKKLTKVPGAFGGYWAGGKLGKKAAQLIGADGTLGQMAGEIGGGIGGGITMNKVIKKIASPEGMKKILPILKKHKAGRKIAARLGLSMTGVVLPEGISTALGAAGVALSAYELIQLSKEVPELIEYFRED